MKVTIIKKLEVEAKTFEANCGVRYWEDASVDGVEDTEGNKIPCRVGERWCPVIDIDSGIILNWQKGKTARIHYKVCDDGTYTTKDADGNIIDEKNCYVPDFMCPDDIGYGDYIIMSVDENGKIERWNNNHIPCWIEKQESF